MAIPDLALQSEPIRKPSTSQYRLDEEQIKLKEEEPEPEAPLPSALASVGNPEEDSSVGNLPVEKLPTLPEPAAEALAVSEDPSDSSVGSSAAVKIANALGLTDIKEVGSVGKKKKSKLPRREWRINTSTGELRGICWRERNKDRKEVRYVGKRDKPQEFKLYLSAYEGWRRTNRSIDISSFVTADHTQG